jgi:hypothetical protein
MDKLKRCYSVLILLLLYSAACPEHKALADNYPIQGTSKDSIWHPGSVNTSPQERTQESGGPTLTIGQRLERGIPSPTKIDPKEIQKRKTPKEPEVQPSDKFTTLQDACDKYAKDAVLQNQENLRIPCGFLGPKWSSDYKAHFNWCMSGNLSNTKSENTGRQQALAQCKKSRCDFYAKQAVLANDYNLKCGCGQKGPQWSSDYSYHYNWCMQGDVVVAQKEDSARWALMGHCPHCCDYAHTAVWQNAENIKRGCGFTGPQWSSNYSYHYSWCMQGENWGQISTIELNKRGDALALKCGVSPQPAPTPQPPPPQTKTTIINGFKQPAGPTGGKIWYMAKIQIPNGVLISVKNANLGLGKQWIVQIIPAGSSSEDCGKAGKTIDINPGASTTKLQNTLLTNLMLGFCLTTNDTFTYSFGPPANWSLEITYKQ